VKRFLERGKTDKRSVLAHGIRSAKKKIEKAVRNMAFGAVKIDEGAINGGVKYTNGDILQADAINSIIEGVVYVTEAMEEIEGLLTAINEGGYA
jgi:hypothetical protein